MDSSLLKDMNEPQYDLDGKQFEDCVQTMIDDYIDTRTAHFKRYGVSVMGERDMRLPGGTRWTPIKSFPDFEGVRLGRQFVWDCKVQSQNTLGLSEYRWNGTKIGSKAKQLRHMLDRSEYGSVCFFLIHWNHIKMVRTETQAQTWIFPVKLSMHFWQRFLNGEEKSISLAQCQELGRRVEWVKVGLQRDWRPNFLEGAVDLAETVFKLSE